MANVKLAPHKAWRGKKSMRWDDSTRDLVWSTTRQLIADGMTRPPIRAVFYRLLSEPGWKKDDRQYNALCHHLGRWRDTEQIPFGVFSDDEGVRDRPNTPSEIAEQIKRWKKTQPVQLPRDGYLHALYVEHGALVAQIEQWCDEQALVVSSKGQLRRENLHTAVSEWEWMAKELGAKGIRVSALVDTDKAGQYIYETHRDWLAEVKGIDLKFFGLTAKQLTRFRLDPDEDWQIDGVMGLDPAWWRREIRRLLLRPT